MDAVLTGIKRRRFDVLVCWRLDRLGRSLKHLVTLLDELQALGVAFVSLQEGIDATTPAGKLQMHILAAIAEFERARPGTGTRGAAAGQAGREAARSSPCSEVAGGAPQGAHGASGGEGVGRVEVDGGAMDQQRDTAGLEPICTQQRRLRECLAGGKARHRRLSGGLTRNVWVRMARQ